MALSGDSPTDWFPLQPALESAFGAAESRYYQCVSWIVNHHPELQEKRATGVVSEVRVTPEALFLIRSMQEFGTLPWAGPAEVTATDYDALPLERLRAGVGAQRRVLSAASLGYALALLGDHRSTLVDESGASKVLRDGTVPKIQRSGSMSRALRPGTSFDQAAESIEEQYDHAVVLTLTLPRESADSLVHSYSVIQEAWKRFRDRLEYSRSDGPRPVDEFMIKHGKFPRSRVTINRRIDTIAEASELVDPADVYPHALRAHAAMYWARQGLTAYHLTELLGWAEPDSAMDYIKMTANDVQSEMKRVYNGKGRV